MTSPRPMEPDTLLIDPQAPSRLAGLVSPPTHGTPSAPRAATAAGPRRLTLFATDTHGAPWLYEVIDAALWLAQGSAPGAQIDIVLLPLPAPRTFASTLRPAIVLLSRLLPLSAVTRLSSWLRAVAAHRTPAATDRWTWCIEKLVRALDARVHAGSLYHEVESGHAAEFRHAGHTITLAPLKAGWWSGLQVQLRAFLAARSAWRSAFEHGEFRASRFLALAHEGIPVGDLAASLTFRENPRLGGRLRACRELFRNLANAIHSCEISGGLPLATFGECYVICPEPTYTHAAYARKLHAMGASVIDIHGYQHKYRLFGPGDRLQNTQLAAVPHELAVDEGAVAAYLQARVLDPAAHLWSIPPEPMADVRDESGHRIEIGDADLTAVVFLHSFDDAQYCFGLDGFDDLHHWTRFTIDTCLANAGVDTVLVKLHPNVDYAEYPGDHAAFRDLHRRYAGNPRVKFVDKATPLVAILRSGRFVGITHHGSVAEEVVFLGHPAIASAYAPWGTGHAFLDVWSCAAEYRELLEGLSRERWAAPSARQRDLLFRFVQEYRLGAISYDDICLQPKFDSLMRERPEGAPALSYDDYSAALEQLTTGSARFREFIELMSQDIATMARAG